MDSANPTVGILIVSHGSQREEANRGFEAMVARVASRLEGAMLLPAFFSLARPAIPEQIGRLAALGARRVLLMPYFLYTGQHVLVDIPAVMDQCRSRFPSLTIELLATLENDPALEDLLVERLLPFTETEPWAQRDAADIEQQSYRIIQRQLADWKSQDRGADWIVRRVVHATADTSFARTMRIHPEATARGCAALADGKPVVCDVRMLQAGITKVRGEILCAIDRPEVAALAAARGCTRSAAAMEHLASRLEGAIVAVGNAPTALWKVLDMAARGGPRPAVVVGLPIGFVGARQSKLALLESGLCYITNTSVRGGSPAAAAVVNVLALMAEGKLE